MTLESDQIIGVLTAHYKKLLTENWIELWAYRDGEQAVKGSIAFSIGCEGRDYFLSLRSDPSAVFGLETR